LVNAGLRMHVPSIVRAQTGTPTAVAGFSLIAEDGNVLPGVPRVLSEVFMPAGKTFDVMMNVPTAGTALGIFDRELSLSANATAPRTTSPARLAISPPGVLANDRDAAGYPLTVDLTTVTAAGAATVVMQPDGSFVATAAAAGTYTFTYHAKNSQGTTSAAAATVSLIFPAATNLAVTVKDASGATITDYRGTIE